jgi:hypothetical protein
MWSISPNCSFCTGPASSKSVRQRGRGRFSLNPSYRNNLLLSNHLVELSLSPWLAGVVTLLSPFAVLVARTVLRSTAVGWDLRHLTLLLLNHRLTHFQTQLACLTYLYLATVTLQRGTPFIDLRPEATGQSSRIIQLASGCPHLPCCHFQWDLRFNRCPARHRRSALQLVRRPVNP